MTVGNEDGGGDEQQKKVPSSANFIGFCELEGLLEVLVLNSALDEGSKGLQQERLPDRLEVCELVPSLTDLLDSTET